MGSSAVSSLLLAVLPAQHRPTPPSLQRLAPAPWPLLPTASSLRPRRAALSAAPDRARLRPRPPRSAMAEAAKGKQGLRVFDNEEELSDALAEYTAELSLRFARERGAFTVVVSGGSLIKSLRKLVEAPYVDSVEWAKWHVFWVDERVVPKDHPDSNYKLAYDGFLSKVNATRTGSTVVDPDHCLLSFIYYSKFIQVPIPSGHVYAINDSLSAEGAADDYETCLKQLVKNGVVQISTATGFPRFDLMLLGMGPDGHVASLFPGHPLLKENQHWVTFIKDSPKPPPERITFTFPVINSSAYIALVVTGAGKAGAVHQALGSENSSSDILPVQLVSLDDGELTWFTDNAAVSKLQDKASL